MDLLGRAWGPTNRGGAGRDGDPRKNMRRMAQGDIDGQEVLDEATSLRDQGGDGGLAEWGDTRGSDRAGQMES